MRENDGSAFALVDIGDSLALVISKDFLAANGFALSVIAFLLWSIRNRFDVTHLKQYARRTREHCTLRSVADHPAEGRSDDATEWGMIEAVVRGGTGHHVADHIRGVVHTQE